MVAKKFPQLDGASVTNIYLFFHRLFSMDYIKTLSILEKTVSAPIYHVIGSIGGLPLYLSTEQGEIALYALGKESLRLTKGPLANVAKPKAGTDFVPFTRDLSHGKELHSINIASLKEQEREIYNARARIISLAYNKEKIAFVSTSGNSGGLFLEEGGEVRKLTDISPFASVSDIGNHFIVGEGMLKGNPRATEIFIAPLDGGKIDILTPKDGSSNNVFEIRNDTIFFSSDFETGGESSRLYSYNLKDRKYESVRFSGQDIIDYNPVEIYSFESENKLVIAGKDGETRIFKDGKFVKAMPGSQTGATEIGGSIFFSHSSLVSTSRIMNTDERGKVSVIVRNTHLNMGRAEYIKIHSDISVPAWLIKPRGRGRRIGIVMVHGGPWSSVINAWDVTISPLVLSGYTVIAPNFRGSTGYGSNFMQMDINDAGGGDLRDVIAARNYLMDNGIVDHVGIMGASYGGFMSFLATAKHPELWEFGIPIAGITDWVEMSSMSDPFFKTFIGMLFGGNIDLMKDRSAVNFLENVKVPLCIIHSQNDSRTPLTPVLKYAQKLHEMNKRFEMHVIPDMGHTITKMKDIVDLFFPALTFLDRIYGQS